MQEITTHLRLLSLEKISFKNEGEIKTCSGKQTPHAQSNYFTFQLCYIIISIHHMGALQGNYSTMATGIAFSRKALPFKTLRISTVHKQCISIQTLMGSRRVKKERATFINL